MFLLRRSLPACRARMNAIRRLYRKFYAENKSDARGLRLLRHWLSPDQREQFDGLGHFEVVGCDSGKRYRIYQGSATNVYEIDYAGRLKIGWCFMPLGELVAGDVMLAQKIALETNEHGTLAIAHAFRPSGELQRRNRRSF